MTGLEVLLAALLIVALTVLIDRALTASSERRAAADFTDHTSAALRVVQQRSAES